MGGPVGQETGRASAAIGQAQGSGIGQDKIEPELVGPKLLTQELQEAIDRAERITVTIDTTHVELWGIPALEEFPPTVRAEPLTAAQPDGHINAILGQIRRLNRKLIIIECATEKMRSTVSNG